MMQRRPLLASAALGAAGLAAGLAGCGGMPVPVATLPGATVPRDAALPAGQMPPPAPREFRAAWVASVAHIDWPSRTGLDPLAQQAELAVLLDQAVALGLNALIVQIRPAADALYASALEPWSEYLTGQQGRAPQPTWDPLQAWCDGAHRRGLELHAWFNPYRARHASARSAPHIGHVAQRLPQAVRRYGDQLWLDPGEPAAQSHTLAVVSDVLRRYPVDAVHIDDYFYPYPVAGAGGGTDLPFPDDEPWARYRAGGGILTRDDWRRDNVDRLVQRLYETVQQQPGVRLGISPFGIGRPDRRPPGVSGFSQYDRLFADVERWLDQGWLDYLVPQLYWPRDQRAQAFEPLLDYWLGANSAGRHVWPGLFTSRVGAPDRPWRADE
ncbi:MAG: glycoside hydrolase family 10 protein, partial [Aquabacterium sp.]